MHGIAFEIFGSVKRDFLAGQALQLPADEFRHQDLILERFDLKSDFFIEDAIQYSADLRDHENSLAKRLWYFCLIIVTQRDSQGVGHVGRLGKLGQAQLALDGPLDLLLGRPAGPVRIVFQQPKGSPRTPGENPAAVFNGWCTIRMV